MNTSTTRAFTIIEILVVLFIAALCSISVVAIYSNYMGVYAQQQVYIDLAQSTSATVSSVDTFARQADSIVSSYVYSGTTYTTGSTTVVFEVPSINSSGDIISSTYDYVVIYATSTSIYRIISAGSGSSRTTGTVALADNVSNLSLTYDNASLSSATKIDVDVVTQSTVHGQTLQSHLHQQSYLRNR